MTSEIKPICGVNRVKLADVVPLDTPFTIYLFPTTYCNFKCNYCAHSLGIEKMKEKYGFKPETMSMETYNKIIQQLKEFPNKLKVLSLTGQGEPLINKNLPHMISIAKEAGVAERIEIITNASLLSNSVSNQLIDAGLDVIRISIQGLTSAKYRDICRYNLDFDELVSNIKYFYQNRKQCKVYVKIMDISLEKGEDKKFYDIFSNISDRMFIEQCKPVYDGVEYGRKISTVTDRYGRVHKKGSMSIAILYVRNIP
ncbi:radical SAM protein [Caloramator sp. mosi_1]|uniref:radical SAM protein n=1 Tax=Caloramator sp. mosi_1 TaxID=3023090 RepID=UPI00236005EB|nr:radical SAM protein [Caloramator sp. mosi_1]WDC83283.1 radical SAM protein [Caloramator sp. mosi_1]